MLADSSYLNVTVGGAHEKPGKPWISASSGLPFIVVSKPTALRSDGS